MASRLESLTNNAGKFTRYEYAHASPSFASQIICASSFRLRSLST